MVFSYLKCNEECDVLAINREELLKKVQTPTSQELQLVYNNAETIDTKTPVPSAKENELNNDSKATMAEKEDRYITTLHMLTGAIESINSRLDDQHHENALLIEKKINQVVSKIDQSKSKLQDENNGLREKNIQLQNENKKLGTDNKKMSVEISSLNSIQEQLRKSIRDRDFEVVKSKELTESLTKEISNLTQTISTLRQEVTKANQRIVDLQKQFEEKEEVKRIEATKKIIGK